MNAVMKCKQAHDLDVFLGLFQTEEIKQRRAERMRWDAMKTAQARKKTLTEEEWQQRERKLTAKHQREAADLVASVTGGLTMAAALVSLAMML